MILEEINPAFFLAEFSFAANTFREAKVGEKEASDNILIVGDIVLHFEHKGRDEPTDDPELERKWFKKKIRGVAVDQLFRTLQYFKERGEISLRSQAGDEVSLSYEEISKAERIIVYRPGDSLPSLELSKKFHYSSRLGKVHLFSESDWISVVEFFITPFEINEYLRFRRNLSAQHGYALDGVTELALVGQYVSELDEERPAESYREELEKFQPPSMGSRFLQSLHGFKSKVTSGEDDPAGEKRRTILGEFALLDRTNLENVSQRFRQCVESALEDKPLLSFRIVNPRRDCCFLFFPLNLKEFTERRNLLQTCLLLAKYDCKCLRAVGVSFVLNPDGSGGLQIDWMHHQEPWREIPEVTKSLQDDYPFRPLKSAVIPRYKFKTPPEESEQS